MRIEKGEDIQNSREWSKKIGGGVRKYKASACVLNTVIKDLQKAEIEHVRREEEDLASKLCYLEEAKLRQKLDFEKKVESSKKPGKETELHAKVSKLVITRFKGVQSDWLRLGYPSHWRAMKEQRTYGNDGEVD